MKERYFSHDAHARSDPKIIKIRRKYGMEGYGIYFALLELMYGEAGFSLQYSDEQFEAIGYDLHTEINIGQFVYDCIEIGLFENDEDSFWSPSFVARMEEIETKTSQRSEKAQNAARARWARDAGKGKGSEETPSESALNAFGDNSRVNDPEYERFAKNYTAQIGSLPSGGEALELLNSYYEDMGPDVCLLAAKQANRSSGGCHDQHKLVLTILHNWADAGVDSVEKAQVEIRAHERRKVKNISEQHQDSGEKIKFVY